MERPEKGQPGIALWPCACCWGCRGGKFSDLEAKVGRTDDGLEEKGVWEVGPSRVQADWRRGAFLPGTGGRMGGPGSLQMQPQLGLEGAQLELMIRQEMPKLEKPLKSHHSSSIPWVKHCRLSDGRLYYALNVSYTALKTQITHHLSSGAAFRDPPGQNELFPPWWSQSALYVCAALMILELGIFLFLSFFF